MATMKTLNVEKELKGITVLRRDSGDKMGEVADVIVHPVYGRVMGLLVRTGQGQESVLATQDFLIGTDAVMATGSGLMDGGSNQLEGGVPALGEVVGTNVVTDDGKLLGRVSEVHISPETPRVIYRVAESTLQRFLGGGFYIAGDLASAYSGDGVRMIVPPDTEERYAAESVDEAFGASRRVSHREAVR